MARRRIIHIAMMESENDVHAIVELTKREESQLLDLLFDAQDEPGSDIDDFTIENPLTTPPVPYAEFITMLGKDGVLPKLTPNEKEET